MSKPSRPCLFCGLSDDDRYLYGEKHSFKHEGKKHYFHYFCLLWSSGIRTCTDADQKPAGDLILDFEKSAILNEAARGKKLKCKFCDKRGATLGCYYARCTMTYHFPCARRMVYDAASKKAQKKAQKKAHKKLSKFSNESDLGLDKKPAEAIRVHFVASGCFPSFCSRHFDKVEGIEMAEEIDYDAIVDHTCVCCADTVPLQDPDSQDVICCSCCKHVSHKICAQKFAYIAGMTHFKCSFCNCNPLETAVLTEAQKEAAVKCKTAYVEDCQKRGVFVPEKDADWELDNSFESLIADYDTCDIVDAVGNTACICPKGTKYDESSHKRNKWYIVLCCVCAGHGCHRGCRDIRAVDCENWICDFCKEITATFSPVLSQTEHDQYDTPSSQTPDEPETNGPSSEPAANDIPSDVQHNNGESRHSHKRKDRTASTSAPMSNGSRNQSNEDSVRLPFSEAQSNSKKIRVTKIIETVKKEIEVIYLSDSD